MNDEGYKTEIVNQGQLLIKGITAHLPKGTSLIIHDEKHTAASIADVVNERIEAAEAAIAAHAVWVEKLEALGVVIGKTDPFIASLKATLVSMFKTSPSKLADCGVSPRKANRTLTSEEKLQRAVNAAATRAARHTVGSRKKELIKAKGGQVTVVSPAPAAAPSAGAAPAGVISNATTGNVPVAAPSVAPVVVAPSSGGGGPILASSASLNGAASNGVTNGAGALNGAGSASPTS